MRADSDYAFAEGKLFQFDALSERILLDLRDAYPVIRIGNVGFGDILVFRLHGITEVGIAVRAAFAVLHRRGKREHFSEQNTCFTFCKLYGSDRLLRRFLLVIVVGFVAPDKQTGQCKNQNEQKCRRSRLCGIAT